MVIAVHGSHPVQIKDVARVERGPEPAFTVVTAQGRDAVLLNIQSQPDGSTLDIATALKTQLQQLRQELPPDMHLAFFYDQSQFVRDSVGSVWDAIIFGLILSVLILYFFLKNWGSVWTAIVTIPITVLITFIAMKLASMSFNMMTLGGIAASIGLIIDNAIIVVEAMCVKIAAGRPRLEGIQEAIGEILYPLIGSTLTPVVVFIPLAFLTGVAGVFFRALALTMVVSLLTSLVLALTLTPSLAAWFIRDREKMEHGHAPKDLEGGFLLTRVIRIYERALRVALRHSLADAAGLRRWFLSAAFSFTGNCNPIFCPTLTKAVLSLITGRRRARASPKPRASLNEAEEILSRESGRGRLFAPARRGNGHVHHRAVSRRFRGQTQAATANTRPTKSSPNCATLSPNDFPMIRWEFPGILTDVIGDLQLTPDPIEIKLFSPDLKWLKQTAPRVEEEIKKIPGVVDTFDGLTETGPSINFRVRPADAAAVRPDRAGHRRRREHRAARPELRRHVWKATASSTSACWPNRTASTASPRCANCRCARPTARSCGWIRWPT